MLDRLLKPKAPPYDPVAWSTSPFSERGRMVCESWALDGYGTPAGAYLFYVLKMAVYVGMWFFFCSFTPDLGEPSEFARWWSTPIAFEKAIVWSMVFEGLGLGCGSGPLTGRYFPPVGGALYFARPGTTKLPLFRDLPLLGGIRRTVLDVALYLGLMAAAVRVLIAPSIDASMFVPLVVLVPLVGLSDRTIFLALRAEHYWTTLVVFVVAHDFIAGAKAVQLALWFWAGFSKLNHHFPAVVCVMTSNSPFTRFRWLRERMYRHYPDDLRPSRIAERASHFGTALELGVPLVLAFAPAGSTWLVAGLVLMVALHAFITSNVPMGVPLEWNVLVVYGGFALFYAHPEVSVFGVAPLGLALFLVFALVVVPLAGNLAPKRLSFLLAMRYYAGNWPYGVWLFRGESYRKLEALTKTSPWIYEQLDHFYDRPTSIGLVGKVLGFRLMHLHGRALPLLVPKAVPRIEDYEYLDGELVAGMVLGWNFGDGHLHAEPLLHAIQEQCGFEEGELRCIFVEPEGLGRNEIEYRIVDAKTGCLDRGVLSIAELRSRQPWASPAPAN